MEFKLDEMISCKSNKRWKNAIIKGCGKYYDFIKRIINDAIDKKRVITKGGKYYSCAKFIMKYNLIGYKYKKTKLINLTCCKSYPRICGGKCCSYNMLDHNTYFNDNECNCDIIPKKYKRIGNCYDDCCVIFKLTHRRKFILEWS